MKESGERILFRSWHRPYYHMAISVRSSVDCQCRQAGGGQGTHQTILAGTGSKMSAPVSRGSCWEMALGRFSEANRWDQVSTQNNPGLWQSKLISAEVTFMDQTSCILVSEQEPKLETWGIIFLCYGISFVFPLKMVGSNFTHYKILVCSNSKQSQFFKHSKVIIFTKKS